MTPEPHNFLRLRCALVPAVPRTVCALVPAVPRTACAPSRLRPPRPGCARPVPAAPALYQLPLRVACRPAAAEAASAALRRPRLPRWI